MKCQFCDEEVTKDGEPTKLYTGQLYQSYTHVGFDEEWKKMTQEERLKIEHSGFSRRCETL